MTAKDVITQKLVKLLTHARGAEAIGNAAEAAAFAAKAQELLDKHELTMSDVEYAAIQKEDPISEANAVRASKPSKVRIKWQEDLADIVARGHHCRIVLVWRGGNRFYFVGRESHRALAEHVYVQLVDFAEAQSYRDYATQWQERKRAGYGKGERTDPGFRAAWYRGFNQAISERMREQRRETERKARAEGHGLALIRLDNADQAVQRYMKEVMRTRRSTAIRGQSSASATGRAQGYQHGRNVSIRRGLGETGSQPKGYLR